MEKKHIYITLTQEEQDLARLAGRETFERRKDAKERWNRGNDDTVEKRIDAYGAEIAASRLTGYKWTYSRRPDPEGDIGPGKQVRHTTHQNGRLIAHPEDKDEHQFFLVTGTFPNYCLVGYIMGKDAKKDENWKELVKGRPCFAVDQYKLEPVEVIDGQTP
jgi:hypothetical protein